MEDFDKKAGEYTDLIIEWGINIALAIIVFVVGKFFAKLLVTFLKKALKKGKVDDTLVSFLGNIAYTALLAFVIISALGTLGINTASFAAVIAAAGLAIGLALQGSLSNFAAGVMIIAFRPFKKGDFVEAAGVSGTVYEVTIFTTTFKTPDNKVVIVPNNSITSDPITNYSKEKKRRVDMVFGIGYDDDIKLAKKTLEQILAKDKRILKDPAPKIALSELADSSINFVCRPWVKTADYWDVYWDTNESVVEAFEKAGLSIPYPQRDLHVFQHNVAAKPANTTKSKKAADTTKKPVKKKAATKK